MRKRRWRKRKEKKQQRLGYREKVKGKSDRWPGKRSDSRERRRRKGWRQTLKRKNEREWRGRWREWWVQRSRRLGVEGC